GRPGATAPRRSVAEETRRQAHALDRQQLALDREELVAAPEPVPAIAADRPVARDHPVAGDREPDRVPPDGAPDGARRAAPPGRAGHAALARDLAPAQRAHAAEDVSIPRPPVGEIERQRLD